jgi:flagella basal body P-ring formation protein FlgA
MQVRVEMWQEVWVASQRLERGQVLTPGMLVGQRIDLLREPGQVVAVDADVEGLELAQVVQQGRPISRRDLVERSLVRRGQFVDAVANEGGLNIRMRALALEAGAAGAVIRIRNLDSNKEFVGQVINETQVQVRF